MTISKDRFKYKFASYLKKSSAKSLNEPTDIDRYYALGEYLREYISDMWIESNKNYVQKSKKQVYYFSMEFLTGRFLIQNLESLGIREKIEEALGEMDISLDKLAEVEKDPALGNGGLGRLAACFLDSMASLGIPGHGNGIRYNYGLFEQRFVNGYQIEFPDHWLEMKNVWEVKKKHNAVIVPFGGHVKTHMEEGALRFTHHDYEEVLAVPYDIPIIGKENDKINTLRLWSAEAVQHKIDLSSFSKGQYDKAFEHKNRAEAISHVLYPNDQYEEGRNLRLKQEYFFVSAGLQSILKTFRKSKKDIKELHQHIAIHINDTHPALAIPELMRILLDEEHLPWEQAWAISLETISYTNHTIMVEALETWPQDMVKELLPRIYLIIKEIDRRHNEAIGGVSEKMSICYGGVIRMANLCVVGAHSVNGVAKLHTDILKNHKWKAFDQHFPGKINNKTNGITHRRWLLYANRDLTQLLNEVIGTTWQQDPLQLEALMEHRKDRTLLDQLDHIKHQNKVKLADYIYKEQGIQVDPNTIFDVHAKRFHEYKRQLMNILNVLEMYYELKKNPNLDMTPRTFIFAGKAAPGYYMAKQIIKLINTAASLINHDGGIQDKLKVVFLENYGVSIAEKLIPAADVSEQISTVTKEASGTGNMKFMMNGALTLATLDGANLEIMEAVGKDNIFTFGMDKDEVLKLYRERTYFSQSLYQQDKFVRRAVDRLTDGFLPSQPMEFKAISEALLTYNDEYLVLKDYNDYRKTQERIGWAYLDQYSWLEKSLVNIAKSGRFSSDYTIAAYRDEIWKIKG